MAPPPAPTKLKLIFTTTSLRNVTIATESDEYYYEIVTPKWDAMNTKVRRLDLDSGKILPVAEMKKEDGISQYTGLRFIDPEKEETGFIPPEQFLSVDDGRKMSASHLLFGIKEHNVTQPAFLQSRQLCWEKW
jgi:hypothetical protein